MLHHRGMGQPYSTELWRLLRARERFVDLPSLGFPTEDERRWRSSTRARTRDRWAARLRGITWAGWGEHLVGSDIAWALRAVRYLKHILAHHERRIVIHALDEGYGWDEISVYLGVSRQAVAKRFGDLFLEHQDRFLEHQDRSRAPDPPIPPDRYRG